MPEDSARRDDDELVSQIDELKARMDRLMQGGTATSNSALLTDPPKQTAPVVESPPAPEPPPPRTRLRDLIGPADSEQLETSPSPQQEAVPFPDEIESAEGSKPQSHPGDERPSSPPPPSKPKPPAVDGSLISVDESRQESRPKAASFDDIGSVIEQELARDASVPPVADRKGPDLASRFGSADESVDAAAPATAETVEVEEEEPEDVEATIAAEVPELRSHVGAVVAIWVFTTVTSGTIAALHFAGII